MPTVIQLQIISNTPGRLRLRVPQQHRQPHAIAQISSILKTVFHEDVYLATSEGESLPSLKPLRKNLDKLGKLQTKKNARNKGSRAPVQ